MSSKSIRKLDNDKIKQDFKRQTVQKEDIDEIKAFESEQANLKLEIRTLDETLHIEENQYKLVATDKKEKKLKAGINIATAGRHEANVAIAIAKKETIIKDATKKSEKNLKKAKEAIIQLQAQIVQLQEDIADNIPDILEDAINVATAACQSTLNYFQPLVDKCYEDVDIIINYPPSHFKKQETLRFMQQRYNFLTTLILNMKVANYTSEPKESISDIERAKVRAQARAEDAQQKARSDARQHEIECQAALIKKAEFAADKARAKARQLERDEELRMAQDDDSSNE